ncbi:MAG: Hsp20/alpha crystallin family protein [Bacteroidales bacterium]|nr:Hsp20/alpha crystallin family protein [Bacteroidales bacterium]
MLQRFFNNCGYDNNMFYVDENVKYGVPPVNISENKEGFEIEMAAPGYQKTDFAANVDGNTLTISVDKNTENQGNENEVTKETEQYIYRQEFSFNSFSRSFTLPEGVDTEKIQGSYENGILTISIPKLPEEVTKKSIEIK